MVGDADCEAVSCGPGMVKFLHCSIILEKVSGERIDDFGSMDRGEWRGVCWADRLPEAESSDYS
jgi:hypothetical protein